MNAPAAAGRQHGFTLLEILVALVVFGFVLAGLGEGTRYGLHAWDAQARLEAQRGDLDAVDRALRRLVEQMDPGGGNQPPGTDGSASALAFISALPDAATGQLVQQADMALGVDSAGRFVLRWTPHLHAMRLRPAPPPAEALLLQGVARVEFAYWPADDSGWRAVWRDRALPALVRIRLVFPPGDRRHWPDILAAPMLAQH